MSESGHNPQNDLINRAKNGDQNAFVDLINEYEYIIRSVIRTFIRRINGHEEDDLVNEVIINAYRVMPTFRGDDVAFKYFLRRTTKGICLNLINKPKHDLQELKKKAQVLSPSPDKAYLTEKIQQCVQEAIKLLPEKLKQIVTLKDIEELRYEEIAEVLKIPMGTVRSRINRGREQLKPVLQKLGCVEML